MRFTFSSLSRFLGFEGDVHALVCQLNAIGIEVEGVKCPLKGIVVCEVVAVEPHPNADSLSLCQVDIGVIDRIQIVCGAPNVHSGMFAVLALEGSMLPEKAIVIKSTTIRGIESNGMLCSELELGIKGGDSDAIVDLDRSEWVAGESFFPIEDKVLDVAITPNRGDLLSVYGIARELAASGFGELKPLKAERKGSFPTENNFKIKNILADQVVFGGCSFIGISNCESPKWLKQQLMLLGVKLQTALVDIPNYFAAVFGRPMHVYNLAEIKGDVRVSVSEHGDMLNALNGDSKPLNPGLMVVRDDDKICSLLGVIGGEESKCFADTREVLLEVACIPIHGVVRSRKEVGIATDASYIFERGGAIVEDIEVFINMASGMILDICGGHASDPIINPSTFNDDSADIALDLDGFTKIAGLELSPEVILKVLQDLGFRVLNGMVKAPPWRKLNVLNHNDLVEAFLRVYGYEKIPAKDFISPTLPLKSLMAHVSRYSEALIYTRGMNEILTWSFMNSNKVLEGHEELVWIHNPVSTTLDVMRNSIIPNLLDTAFNNFDNGEKDVSIFEQGMVYTIKGENPMIAGLRIGMSAPRNIYGLRHAYDFFDVKADVLAIVESFGLDSGMARFSSGGLPSYYHPVKAASVCLGGGLVAFCGVLVPKLSREGMDIAVFEIFQSDLLKIDRSEKESYVGFSYPLVRRDFAFLFENEVEVQSIVDLIGSLDSGLIKDVSVFDKYKTDEGPVSIAVCVVIGSNDRTLSSDEISNLSDNLVNVVENELHGVLRKQS